MSANAFIKSDDYNDASKCLAFLQEKGVEIHIGLTAEMPSVVFHGYFTPTAVAEWDREATEAELREKSNGAWSEWLESTDLKIDDKTQSAMAKSVSVKRARGGASPDPFLKISNPILMEFVLESLAKKKEEVIKARFDELCPKVSKSKATGARSAKRDKSEFDCVVKNTEEEAQGGGGDGKPKYEYCLPCDDGAVMLKDGKIQVGKGKDGKDLKPQSFKAVRKNTPFLSQGACKCGITWDRAKGSKKLKELSIQGAFVMGCDKDREQGSDFCSKHQGKTSVYSDKYKTGHYQGLTYAQVLYNLHQDGGEVLADDGDWIQAEVGEKWMTETVVGA